MAALSASKFRRGATRQSATTSMAGFLVNSSSAAVSYSRRRWYCSWSSPTDQPVRKFKDGLGISIMTMQTFFTFNISRHVTSMEWCLRRVVPAAAVTTHAKPHAQQQLARDLEVERAAMGQRCRLHAPGLVSCVRQHASCQPCT